MIIAVPSSFFSFIHQKLAETLSDKSYRKANGESYLQYFGKDASMYTCLIGDVLTNPAELSIMNIEGVRRSML